MSILILLAIVFVVLQNEKTQTYLVKKVFTRLSEKTHTDFEVEKIYITRKNIVIKELIVKDIKGNILMNSGTLRAKIEKMNILTTNFVLKNVKLNGSEFNIVTYPGDSISNLQYILSYLGNADTTKIKSNVFALELDKVSLRDAKFSLINGNVDSLKNASIATRMRYDISKADINNFSIVGDSLAFDIKNLAAREHSGFEVKSLALLGSICSSGLRFDDLDIKTKNSDLIMNKLHFTYNSQKDMADFINKVSINATLNHSKVSFKDITYFAPDIAGMHDEVRVSGDVSGKISKLRAKDMNLKFGGRSQFLGDIRMNGLPNIKETFVQLKIDMLSTNPADISQFSLPKGKKIDLPVIVDRFGNTIVKGNFTGFYNDFVSYAKFDTEIGGLSTDILLKDKNNDNIPEYSGKIKTNHFDLGKFLDSEKMFGKITMSANIEGQGIDAKTVDLNINGLIDSMVFRNQSFEKVQIKAELAKKKFNGDLIAKDDKLDIDFKGLIDFSDTIPELDFTADIKKLRLGVLEWAKVDKNFNLSAKVEANLVGLNIDEMLGTAIVDSLLLTNQGKVHHLDKIRFSIMESDGLKKIILDSDLIQFNALGKMKLSRLGDDLFYLASEYIPALKRNDSIQKKIQSPFEQNFNFDLKVIDFTFVNKLFVSHINVADSTLIKGKVNTLTQKIEIMAQSDRVQMSKHDLRQLDLKLTDTLNRLDLTINADTLLLNNTPDKEKEAKTMFFENVSLKNQTTQNIADVHLTWKDQDEFNTGDIKANINFNQYPDIKITTGEGKLTVDEENLQIAENKTIWIRKNKVELNDVSITGFNAFLKADGIISGNPDEKLMVNMKNIDASLSDFILNNLDLDVNGIINGKAVLSNLYDAPSIIADIVIDGFELNNTYLGVAKLNSEWSYKDQIIKVEALIKNDSLGQAFSLDGKYLIGNEDAPLNFDIELNKTPIDFLQPFLSSIFTEVAGNATGKLAIKGTLNRPMLVGKILANEMKLRVGFLNVDMYLSHDIVFTNKSIEIKDAVLKDKYGNTAPVNGEISHDGLKDFYVNIIAEPNNFYSLNTSYTDNSQFYGQAFSSGLVYINGTPDNMRIDVRAKTEKNTKITVPISYDVSLSDNYFIKFVSEDEEYIDSISPIQKKSDFTFDMELDATSGTEVNIILPYQLGTIKSDGEGGMKFNMDKDGKFYMYGQYDINGGSFLFSLQNLISRNFNLMDGSYIRWSGDPTDANLSIAAVYEVKASLAQLPGFADSTSRNINSVPVDCIIRLNGKLMDPNIHFSFQLPNVDENIKQMIYQAIDTTNKDEMNRQMISLLAVNSFSFSGGGFDIAGNLESSSVLILTNQVNNWLSQLSKDVKIGVDYRPSRNFTPDDVRAIFKTKLFNDRVIIDGSVGLMNSNNYVNSGNSLASNLNIEYLLSKDGNFRLRVFNRTNEDYYLSNKDPYTQGVGLFYRREFDHIREFFIQNILQKKDKE